MTKNDLISLAYSKFGIVADDDEIAKFIDAVLQTANTPIKPISTSPTAVAVADAAISGALFDFCGYLTTLPRQQAITASEAHEASPMVEALKQWADKRNLHLDDADVQGWSAALATTPAAAPDMVSVKKVDANNYCRILAALGMEEEGDPVAEVKLLREMDKDFAQTIEERDTAEGWADGLASLIGKHFGKDIGEHSSAHCPWQAAKEIIEDAEPPTAAAQVVLPEFDLRTSYGARSAVAWYFTNVLQRHDFTKYINNTLAADFACALAPSLLAGVSAPAAVTVDPASIERQIEEVMVKIGAWDIAWVEWQNAMSDGESQQHITEKQNKWLAAGRDLRDLLRTLLSVAPQAQDAGRSAGDPLSKYLSDASITDLSS